MFSPSFFPFIVVEVYVPIDWINEDVKTILRVSILFIQLEVSNLINSKNLREAFDILSIWVFGNRDKILVQKLYSASVFTEVVGVLANASTNKNMLEQLKNKLQLELVSLQSFLSIHHLLVVCLHCLRCQHHSLSQLISKNEAFKTLFVISSDCATCCN